MAINIVMLMCLRWTKKSRPRCGSGERDWMWLRERLDLPTKPFQLNLRGIGHHIN